MSHQQQLQRVYDEAVKARDTGDERKQAMFVFYVIGYLKDEFGRGKNSEKETK